MIDNNSFNFNFLQSNTFGLVIGAVIGFFKAMFHIIILDITWGVVFETFILSAIGASTGIAIAAFVKWLKKMWLGRK